MEISGMLIWATVLVSLIVFIVLLVKAFKSWGVVHTILLTVLFIEAWTFLFFVGGVAHQRIAYTKLHDTLAEKVDGLLKSVEMEMNGDRLDPKLNLEKFSPLSNELNRIILERGRVWRGAQVQTRTPATANTPATAVFQLPALVSNQPITAPVPGAAAAAIDSGLAVDSVVYLFGEELEPNGMGLIPKIYLGEFVVTEVKELMLTMRPTTPLTKAQETAFTGSETWTVFELMPLDSHTAFAAAGSSSEEGAEFGRMDEKMIAKDFETPFNAIPEELKAKITQKIMQAYVNDGARAPDETPPEALWYRVKFVKDYTVDVDAKGGRSPLEGGYHDTQGNMTDARLKRDSDAPAVIKTGTSHIFDEGTANQLSSEGFVERGATVFVRPLNDYAFAFRETRRMEIKAKQDTMLVTRENKEMERSTKVTNEQELYGEEVATKLRLDKAQYEKEVEVIARVSSDLETQISDKKVELSQLYGSIHALHDRLVKHQQEMASIVNAAAPTSTP